jgi:hypothetical protein
MRVGDTRFDLVSGGQRSAFRLAYQIAKATYDYSRFAPKKPGPYTPTASEVTARYLSNKNSPGIGAGKALVTGRDFKGDTITPAQVGLSLAIPWNANDIYDAWKLSGPGMASAVGVASFYGVGGQTYKDKEKKPRKAATYTRGRTSY